MLLYSSDFYGNLNCKTRSKSMMHVDNNQAWSLELHGCISNILTLIWTAFYALEPLILI